MKNAPELVKNVTLVVALGFGVGVGQRRNIGEAEVQLLPASSTNKATQIVRRKSVLMIRKKEDI